MEAIRQNGKIILHSNDGISIKISSFASDLGRRGEV